MDKRYHRLAGRLSLILFSSVLGLILLEVTLTLRGVKPRYVGDPEIDNPVPAPYWINESAGTRFLKSGLPEDAAGLLSIVNRDGFSDTDEFSPVPMSDTRSRVLVLGDSFTWGASATFGRSFISVAESYLKQHHNALVWNAAIPATTTSHAILTLQSLGLWFKPHIVFLGFYMNDFKGNLFPLDHHIRRKDLKAIQMYDLDYELNPVRLPPERAYERAFGFPPAQNISQLKYVLCRTRLASEPVRLAQRTKPILESRLRRLKYRFYPPSKKESEEHRSIEYAARNQKRERKERIWQKAERVTKSRLQLLKSTTSEYGARLIVMIIPALRTVIGMIQGTLKRPKYCLLHLTPILPPNHAEDRYPGVPP